MLTNEIFFIIFLAYLTGSIPSAVWVGKLFYKIDVREYLEMQEQLIPLEF